DSSYDLLGLDAGRREESFDGIGHDAGVHDFALDDRVIHHRRERDLGEHRPAGGVGNRDELDKPAANVQAYRRRIAPEESHSCPLVEGWLRPALLASATGELPGA